MEEFETIDRDGNRCCFQYSYEKDQFEDEYIFKVYSIPIEEFRWFTYRVGIVNDILAKSLHLSANGNNEFRAKGIPEKIIQIASAVLNKDIQSSSNTFQAGNFLTPESRKVWERLVAESENASLDELKGYFIFKRNG